MTIDLDEELRATMRGLAETPAPVGLVEASIRRGRRQRRAYAALGVAAAVAVVAGLTPVVLSALPGGTAPAPTVLPGAPNRQPLVVTAYSGVRSDEPAAGDEPLRSLLLDPGTGEYVEVPYSSVLPSPDGSRVLVQAGSDTVADPLRTGVLDRSTMEVRWIEGYHGSASWSPDGQEILMTTGSQATGSGFVIIDAATLSTAYRSFPVYGWNLVWTPDGEQLAVTRDESTGNEQERDRVVGIEFYSRDGQLQRTVPAQAPLRSASDFSPDGARIALHHYAVGEPIQVVDAESGAVINEITTPSSQLCVVVGWVDDSHLLLRLWNEPGGPSTLSIVDLAGDAVATVPLLDGATRADDIRVGSAVGLSGPASQLAF